MMNFIQRIHVITASPNRPGKHGGLQIILPSLPDHRKERPVRGNPGSVMVHRIKRRRCRKNHSGLIKQDGIYVCRKQMARSDRHCRCHCRRRDKRIQGKAHGTLHREQRVSLWIFLVIVCRKTGDERTRQQKTRKQSKRLPLPQRYLVHIVRDHAPLRILHTIIIERAYINVDIFSRVIGIGNTKGRFHTLQQKVIIPSYFCVDIHLYLKITGNRLHIPGINHLLHQRLHGSVPHRKIKLLALHSVRQIDFYFLQPVILGDKSLLHHIICGNLFGNHRLLPAAHSPHFLLNQTKRPENKRRAYRQYPDCAANGLFSI